MQQDSDKSDDLNWLLNRIIVDGSTWQRNLALLRFLLLDAGLVRDPLLFYAIFSSLSRSALIFSINKTASTLATETLPILILLASAVFTLFFSHITRIRSHMVIKRLQRNLRKAMSQRLMAADVDFLLRQDKGQVYTVMTQEIQEVSNSAINLVEALQALLLLMICIPYLFWISWFSGVATLVAVAIGASGYFFAELPARRLVERANDATARFFDRVNDMLSGWMEIRLRQSRRRDLEQEISETVDQVRNYSIEAERRFSSSQAFGQAALISLMVAIVVLLPLLQGADSTTMFQVLTVVLLTSGPIEQIFNSLPRMARTVASQKKISDVVVGLKSEQSGIQLLDPGFTGKHFSTIELRDVVARVGEGGRPGAEEEEAFELGPINLTLVAGETVFVGGGNGAGKSTLVALICGLRFPDSGQILIDGVQVTPENILEYRSLFSAVLSQFHLFRRTYGLGPDEISVLDQQITRLGLHGRVAVQEDTFSTLGLSSGQRRRLALAIAIAESRPIIVLDEYAADQDPASRAFFYSDLIPDLGQHGRMVLAVTHDEHNFSKCDRLIKMDAGQIVSDERMRKVVGAEDTV